MDIFGTRSLHRASPAKTFARVARRIERSFPSPSRTDSATTSPWPRSPTTQTSRAASPRSGAPRPGRFYIRQADQAPVGCWEALHKRLPRDGIASIDEIARLDTVALVARYGKFGPPALPLRPRRGPLACRSGSTGQGHVLIDHPRRGPVRRRGLEPDPVAADRDRGAASEEGGPRRRVCHAKAQDHGFPDRDPRPPP